MLTIRRYMLTDQAAVESLHVFAMQQVGGLSWTRPLGRRYLCY